MHFLTGGYNMEKSEDSINKKKDRRIAKKARRRERRERHANVPKEIKIIDIESLYYPYKPWMDDFKKYWREGDDTVFKISNSPWTLFVEDYLLSGEKILDDFNDHVKTKWILESYYMYKKNISNINSRRLEKGNQSIYSAKRLIKLIEDIKLHGYCEGEYDNDDNLINVLRGYIAPNGDKGYKLLWGNRRSAVCAGLGMRKIKVRCWEYY